MAEPNRKLAAILSADVVGYSKLMADDEAATVETLQKYRAAVDRVIARHKGRVVNAPGDNILAEFSSAVAAVLAAVEFQKSVEGRNLEVAEHRRMQFRVGVNLGDVIEEADGTIYGDGVNIAARMEALADTGGICISNAVYEAVQGKIDFGFEFLGEQQVKNIDRPITVYRVRSESAPMPGAKRPSTAIGRRAAVAIAGAAAVIALAVITTWFVTGTPDHDTSRIVELPDASDPLFDLPDGPVIAVLPFENLSGDPEQEFFATGLTEDIINRLSRFNRLFVIARNSTAKYADSELGVKQIADELGARFLIEGTVRRLGNTVRITVQLVDPELGAHVWSETYDRDLSGANLFDIQDQITRNVVATIGDTFGVVFRADIAKAARTPPKDLEGYQCYFRLFAYYEALSPEGHAEVRDCAERAIETDPTSLDALTTLIWMYMDEHRYGFNPRAGSLDRALDIALTTLELDPENLLARHGLAEIYFARGELEAFFSQTARVITVNPNNATALAALGDKMIFAGENERGMAMMRKAVALNPDHPDWMLYGMAFYHYKKNEYQTALDLMAKNRMRDFFWTHAFLAAVYGQLDRPGEGANSVNQLLELYPDFGLHVRDELAKWNFPDASAEHFVDGLRKAGLDVPDKPPLTQ